MIATIQHTWKLVIYRTKCLFSSQGFFFSFFYERMGSPMTPAVKDFTCSLTGDRCSLHQAAMLQKKSHGKHNKQTCTYRLTLSLATGQKKNKTKPFRLRWEWQYGRHQCSGCCCCSALAWVSGEIHFSQPFLTHVKDKGYLYPFSILGLQELSSTTLLSHKYQSRGKSWGLTNLIYSFIFLVLMRRFPAPVHKGERMTSCTRAGISGVRGEEYKNPVSVRHSQRRLLSLPGCGWGRGGS